MTDVSTPTSDYLRMLPVWALPRTLMGGTSAMRQAGRIYLPQEEAESDTAYDKRLTRSTLFNAFRKTVEDMTGKVFAKPVGLGDDVPDALKLYAENIDLTGRHLDVFAKDAFKDALQTGIGYILTEMQTPLAPRLGPDGQPLPITRLDEQVAGRRPYLVYIRAEDLIGWQSEIVGGREVLTQARIKEIVSVPDGPYLTKAVEQIRVLTPGRFELWRRNETTDKAEWGLYAEGLTSVNAVTLAPVYTNRTGFMTGAPPLEDLADLNVAHWQSQSDQRNILHVARLPLLFLAGFNEDDEIIAGAGSFTKTSDPNAKMMYVEHSGAAIGSGREDLAALELAMQVMGLELLIPRPGSATATGAAIDQAKMNAPLAFKARGLQDALEQSFAWMAEYDCLGADGGGSPTVNTDYGVSMRDAADLTTLIAAVNAGHITRELFLMELKRRGVLSDAVDVADELDRLDTQPPTFARGVATGAVA